MTQPYQFPATKLHPPDEFVVEVSSELRPQTLQRHGRAVNVILRLAMLAGLQMELDATLNLLCDFVHEIVAYDRALIYFWQEEQDGAGLRLVRGFDNVRAEAYSEGNVLNLWASRFGRPLVLSIGENDQADAFLESVYSSSALVLPIVTNNRVAGTLLLFSQDPEHFTHEHAQLLWIFSLVADNQLSKECAHEGLLRFAFTDYLTGLKTRGYFEQQLELETKRAERKSTVLSLLMIDIDHFKRFNDHHGHHVGDQLLHEVALVLSKDMREIDTVARYGGEEFVIILPETDAAGALHVAQRIRHNMEEARFFAGSLRMVESVTVSVGITIFGQDAQTKQELVQNADAALYEAKARGRNRVVLYSELAVARRQAS